MYAKYEYNSGATQANILADIVLILTGTTDVGSLSASCNKTTSTITSTVASGWTVHDASAGSNKQVIKAPYVDNGSAYKYAEITLTASEIQLHGNETWNETAHTYTNKTANTSYYQRWSSSNAGRVYIFASARFIALAGDYTTYYGDSTYGGMCILCEMSREQPWNTTAAGYPTYALINSGECIYGSMGCYYPRLKNNLGNDVVGINAKTYLTTVGCRYDGWSAGTSFPQGANARVYDSTGGRQVPFFEICATDVVNFVSWVGETASVGDIWATPKDLLGQLETVTKNSVDYLAMTTHTTNGHRWAFRKG